MARRTERRGGGSGRFVGLLVLAAIVAAVMLYFGNCVPGFGAGQYTAPAATAPSAPRSDDARTEAADTLQVKVDGDQCRRGSEPPVRCLDLCTSLATEPVQPKVLVDGTLGTHAAVDALRRCLAEQGHRDVVVRTE